MPLPGAITQITVNQTYLRSDGSAKTGVVFFSPSVRSRVAGTTLVVDTVVARLVNGSISVVLAYQDDPDLIPTGWTYRVIEKLDGESPRGFSVKLPSSGPVVLDSLSTVDPVVPTEIKVRSVSGYTPDAFGNIGLPPAAGAAPNTRLIVTTSGLQGGGDLSADRTLSPVYGSTSGTVCQGNDSRLSDARTPLAHTHPQSDITGLAAALASKPGIKTVLERYVTSGNISTSTGTNTWGPLTGSPTLTIPAAVGDYVSLDVNAAR